MKELKYLELIKNNKNDELILLLEEEIRKNSALKLNSKSRIQAMTSFMKNIKEIHSHLKGCGVIQGKNYFTDSYSVFILNDNLGYKNLTLEDNYPEMPQYVDPILKIKQPLSTTFDELSYYVKTKKDFYTSISKKNNFIEYKKLSILLKILGKDCNYFCTETAFIAIEKNTNETGIIVSKIKKGE
ncbi:MAG: hypothetical protein ACRCZK_01920 [Oscillospiraceae bacterium]